MPGDVRAITLCRPSGRALLRVSGKAGCRYRDAFVNVAVLFGTLLVAHALCDYPLQGDFLARAKNRAVPIPGVPWYQALGAHAIIHGGAVALITGMPLLGVAEVAIHALTDDAKCTGKIGFDTDQSIHIACKLAWAIIAGAML